MDHKKRTYVNGHKRRDKYRKRFMVQIEVVATIAEVNYPHEESYRLVWNRITLVL